MVIAYISIYKEYQYIQNIDKKYTKYRQKSDINDTPKILMTDVYILLNVSPPWVAAVCRALMN